MNRFKAYVALGSNLGDREKNLRDALNMIGSEPGLRVTAISSFLDNPAVGGPADSPAFLNAVAELDSGYPPHHLLCQLLEIERAMGRVRGEKWGPRIIDLDLLLFSEAIISIADMTIPHPRLHERRFVLEPLAEIAPDLIVPGLDRTVRQLLEELCSRS